MSRAARQKRPPMGRPSRIGLAIVAWCGLQSRDLVATWQNSPLDRLAWIALAVWLLPVAWYWLAVTTAPRRETALLYGLGLGLALLGRLGEMHTAAHAGLLLAVGGLLPWNRSTAVWLLCGAAWMPAATWAARPLTADGLLLARVAVAAFGAALLIRTLRRVARPAVDRARGAAPSAATTFPLATPTAE